MREHLRHPGVRTTLKLILPVLALALIGYRVKWGPAQVIAHEVEPSSIVAEVLGTGTLEARVKTIISPRIQERLAEVLVDQNDLVSGRSGARMPR